MGASGSRRGWTAAGGNTRSSRRWDSREPMGREEKKGLPEGWEGGYDSSQSCCSCGGMN